MEKVSLNPDYSDMLCALSDAGAEFLIVGAYAVAAHGLHRTTKDIDIWIRNTPENTQRVWKALAEFGAPLKALGITQQDLLDPEVVIQLGVPPNRIDILTRIQDVEFDEAYAAREEQVFEGVCFPYLNREHLIRSKLAAGRDQDRADARRLQQQRRNLAEQDDSGEDERRSG